MAANGWVYEQQPNTELDKKQKFNINNCNSLERLTAIAYTLCQATFTMTKKQILKLRPEFKLGWGMTMIDWFEITEGVGFFCIRSGLRHADGETKSPYHYEDCVGGKNAEKIAMEKFNNWWASLNVV